MLAHSATSVQNQLGRASSAVASIVSRLRERSVAEFRVRGLQAVQARLERLQGLIARGHSSERMVPVFESHGDRSFASLLRFPAGVEVLLPPQSAPSAVAAATHPPTTAAKIWCRD